MMSLEVVVRFLEDNVFLTDRILELLECKEYSSFFELSLPENISHVDVCSVLYRDDKLNSEDYFICMGRFFKSDSDIEKYLTAIDLYDKYSEDIKNF